MRFGDIDIDVKTDILYGATTRGQFFNIDLNNLAARLPFTQDAPPDTVDRPSLHIAFNIDYSILYGQYQVVDGLICTPDVVVMPLGEPTAESCYQACLRRFTPGTTFVFNLFRQNLADPALTCSCCEQCIVTVPTPGGQVFATKCRPPLELVDASKKEIKAKAGDHQIEIQGGKQG